MKKNKLTICLLCMAWTPLFGADIQDVYDAAKDNDPVVGAASANYQARRQIVPQARSGLLPSLVVTGTSADSRQGIPGRIPNPADPINSTLNSPSTDFNEHNWRADLVQPLVNLPAWFNYRAAKASAHQAQWDFAAIEQNLIVRVVEAYMNVLRAQARLESTNAEEEAVRRQLEQVQQRFDVGLVAITDVLESTAAYDNTVVRRVQSEGDHAIFFESLRTIAGISFDELARLSPALPIVDVEPTNEEEWVSTALAENLQIKSAQDALTAAARDHRAKRSGHLPTLEASASHFHNVTGGASLFSSAGGGGNDTKFDQRSYSLRATIPIYQGGLTSSRAKESRYRLEAARQNLLERQLTVERDTRNLFRSVSTDVVRVRARNKAIKSSESALEATQTGYEVGTRNIVDVLQAQQRLFSSQFDYADARYSYVTNLLRLKQAAGTLNGEDLAELNQFSDANDPVKSRVNIRSIAPSGP